MQGQSKKADEAIWAGIRKGEIKPGNKIVETRIARENKLSQTVVREAILRLRQMGLLDYDPYKGHSLVNLSDEQIVQIVDLRERLEPYSLSLAWHYLHDNPEMKKQVIQELTSKLRKMEKLYEEKDELECEEAHEDFHQKIWKSSNNVFLSRGLIQLTQPFFRFVRILRVAGQTETGDVESNHAPFIDFLNSNKFKEDKAEKLVNNHIRLFKRTYLKSNHK